LTISWAAASLDLARIFRVQPEVVALGFDPAEELDHFLSYLSGGSGAALANSHLFRPRRELRRRSVLRCGPATSGGAHGPFDGPACLATGTGTLTYGAGTLAYGAGTLAYGAATFAHDAGTPTRCPGIATDEHQGRESKREHRPTLSSSAHRPAPFVRQKPECSCAVRDARPGSAASAAERQRGLAAHRAVGLSLRAVDGMCSGADAAGQR
jgi:hypothetical protein